MANRLSSATSPYLLQHADNPVDWYEWGDEAFARARERDVPVLLSVGYAACHWCHVMAHESFEDAVTAEQMNAGFVCVKVDREERPDVDAAYMSAVTALTGQGGWPMTVFLTPDGRPFYAGTYYPPVPVQGMPAFRQVLAAVSESWAARRSDVEDAGSQISAALAERTQPARGAGSTGMATEDDLAAAVAALAADEDTARGGFGGAPKFPPSMVCEFLLRRAGSGAPDAAQAAALARRTLAAMAASGMYDQVAGGFARYAVDAGWVVPHFEKMLYDNALLARAYLHWWRLDGSPTGRRIAVETCDWMLAALGTAQGGFASSLDADTPVPDGRGGTRGVEGATYTWTPAQLLEVLGPDDGAWAAELLGVSDAGTFEHGTSTLQLLRDPWDDAPGARGEAERWARVRAHLARARATRPQPHRDDKVVAAWNGLAIAALAEVGVLCDRPDLLEAARTCADLLLTLHRDAAGHLLRVSRDGVAGSPPGVLEDSGDLAEGLLALHAATGEPRWAQAATELADDVLARFSGAGAAGAALHDTAADVEDPRLAVLGRPADPTDGATPSGASAAAGALLTLGALTGATRYRVAAESALSVTAALARQAPRFAGWGLAVAQAAASGPVEVAVVGPRDRPATAALHRTAMAATSPGAVVALGEPTAEGAAPAVPLLEGRGLVGGRPAAYVCRQFVCSAPVVDPEALAAEVGAAVGAGQAGRGAAARAARSTPV